MSNSGRLILPSELMSMTLTKSSTSHGGKLAISAVLIASANSFMSIVPELSTSAHSKNCTVVVPLALSHLVNLTSSSSNSSTSSSATGSSETMSFCSERFLGIISCRITPTDNAIEPRPTIIPLLTLCVSSGSTFVSIPVTGGNSLPNTFVKDSIITHAENINRITEIVFAVEAFNFTQRVNGVSPSCMLSP